MDTRPFEGIGPALRMLRVGRGLAQKELAVRASVTPAMLSGYEREKRRPELSTLERLLMALDADVKELARAVMSVQAARARENRESGEFAVKSLLANLLELGVIDRERLADLVESD